MSPYLLGLQVKNPKRHRNDDFVIVGLNPRGLFSCSISFSFIFYFFAQLIAVVEPKANHLRIYWKDKIPQEDILMEIDLKQLPLTNMKLTCVLKLQLQWIYDADFFRNWFSKPCTIFNTEVAPTLQLQLLLLFQCIIARLVLLCFHCYVNPSVKNLNIYFLEIICAMFWFYICFCVTSDHFSEICISR